MPSNTKFSSEADIRKFLIKKVFNAPDFIVERIETSSAGANGVPDLHLCTENGGDFWIELKHQPSARKDPPELTGTMVWAMLRPSQRSWFKRRLELGQHRNCFVFVGNTAGKISIFGPATKGCGPLKLLGSIVIKDGVIHKDTPPNLR